MSLDSATQKVHAQEIQCTPLVAITEETHPVILDIKYATTDNFTGQILYSRPLLYLHADAMPLFEKAISLAKAQGLKLKIFDGFRPRAAADRMWEFCPDPNYVAPPDKGSNHTRGVAIDLTLADQNGQELDMGTPFDSFSPDSHHGPNIVSLSPECVRNRCILLGLMIQAGWDYYNNEWWHYQLIDSRGYTLLTGEYGMINPL